MQPLKRILNYLIPGTLKRHDIITVIDSGSGISLAGAHVPLLKHVKIEPILNDIPVLSGAFGGEKAEVIGYIRVQMLVDEVLEDIKFHIVNSNEFDLILGWGDIVKMRLEIRNDGLYSREGKVIGSEPSNYIRVVNVVGAAKVCQVVCSDPARFGIYHSGALLAAGSLDNENNASDRYRTVFSVKKDESIDLIDLSLPEVPDKIYNIPELGGQPSDKELLSEFELFWPSIKDSIDPEVLQKYGKRIRECFLKHPRVMSFNKMTLGRVPPESAMFKEEFSAPPIPAAVFRTTPERGEFIEEQIKMLEKLGVVKEQRLNFVSGRFFAIPKRGRPGEYRCIYDSRVTNTLCIPHNVPVPKLEGILRNLAGYSLYISVDVASAYFCISIDPSNYPYYSFRSPVTNKSYVFVRLPQGNRNSGAFFQTFMTSQVVRDLHIETYLDDLSKGFNDSKEGVI